MLNGDPTAAAEAVMETILLKTASAPPSGVLASLPSDAWNVGDLANATHRQ